MLIRNADLRWLVHAVRHVQTRSVTESVECQELIHRFDIALEENPQLEAFCMSFSRSQVLLLSWAADEGNCRDVDERLLRGRIMVTLSKEAT